MPSQSGGLDPEQDPYSSLGFASKQRDLEETLRSCLRVQALLKSGRTGTKSMKAQKWYKKYKIFLFSFVLVKIWIQQKDRLRAKVLCHFSNGTDLCVSQIKKESRKNKYNSIKGLCLDNYIGLVHIPQQFTY